MQRQIILDTETTGLSPEKGHRIIEIGCLEMINRRLTGKYYHQYINPERPIEKNAIEVHGITNEFLEDKLLFKDIFIELIDYIKDAELIIHNAPFDVGFLNHELALVGHKVMVTDYCGIIDTLQIARKKHPGQQNNLDALCRRYHVNNDNRDFHGALLDAELLAQVYLLMTGGQAQLFQEEQRNSNNAIQTPEVERLKKNRRPLKVIVANESECAADQAYWEDVQDQ